MKAFDTQENIPEIQEKINNLFYEAFKNYEGGKGLSVPCIPRISSSYLENRTVVLGQETNTWFEKKDIDDSLKNIFLQNADNIYKICLTERYDEFIRNHASTYLGNFWNFNKMIYKEGIINGEMIHNNSLSHCWLNLFAVEACKNKNDKNGRPTKNEKLRAEIMAMQKNLVFDVLCVLKPKLILALTGHGLDAVLLKYALGTSRDLCKIKTIDKKRFLSKEMLGEIKIEDENNPLSEIRIIRSYHPTYFMSRINTHKILKKTLTESNIKMSNSEYYKKIFIKYLKNLK